MTSWGFPKLGVPFFLRLYNKDYNILGSMLGSPLLGNHHRINLHVTPLQSTHTTKPLSFRTCPACQKRCRINYSPNPLLSLLNLFNAFPWRILAALWSLTRTVPRKRGARGCGLAPGVASASALGLFELWFIACPKQAPRVLCDVSRL